jgi:iron complex transport system substrate-binding protein
MKLWVLIIVLLLASCDFLGADDGGEHNRGTGERATMQPFPVFVGDAVIEGSPAEIISLSSALTEILFEFGHGDRLVGRSPHCNYPPGIGTITTVETGSRFDVEQIIRIAPDLLLLSTPITDKDHAALEREGVAVVVIPTPRNIAEFRSVYNIMGLILHGAFVGTEAGESAFSPITQVLNNPGVVDLGNFIYVTENMALATGDTLEHAVLSRFGNNLAADGLRYVFDKEELLTLQPNLILLNSNLTLDCLQADEFFRQLDAVAAERVIVLNNAYFERATARIIDLITHMKNQHILLE